MASLDMSAASPAAVVVVLCDSIDCDGRFLLHGIASRAHGGRQQQSPLHRERLVEDIMMACGMRNPNLRHLHAIQYHVAWISCGVDTLSFSSSSSSSWFVSRKNASSLSSRQVAASETGWNVYNLPHLLAEAVRTEAKETLATGSAPPNPKINKEAVPVEYRVIRQLYQQVLRDVAAATAAAAVDSKTTTTTTTTTTGSAQNIMVVMDDVGALEVLVGKKLAAALVLQMVSWVRRKEVEGVSARLFLRQGMDVEWEAFLGRGGGNDNDEMAARPTAATTAQTRDVAMVVPSWIGAGASAAVDSNSPLTLELANVVVDVVPHPSSAFSSSLGGAAGPTTTTTTSASIGKVIVTDRGNPNSSWQRPI